MGTETTTRGHKSKHSPCGKEFNKDRASNINMIVVGQQNASHWHYRTHRNTLTSRLSPWWTVQRSDTPFATIFFCKASTASGFHSQAWTWLAPACTRYGRVKYPIPKTRNSWDSYTPTLSQLKLWLITTESVRVHHYKSVKTWTKNKIIRDIHSNISHLHTNPLQSPLCSQIQPRGVSLWCFQLRTWIWSHRTHSWYKRWKHDQFRHVVVIVKCIQITFTGPI